MLRYVILLPLFFNDGSSVPLELFRQTYEEIVAYYGGVTVEANEITGYWENEGTRYKDRSLRVSVTGEETPENEAFMQEFKETLKERFDQLEIWIEVHHIRLI